MSTNNTKAFETYESEVRSYCRNFPTVFVKAKGSIQTDENGKEYIDFFCGSGALNYGHNNPYIKEKVVEYLQNDGVMHALDMYTKPKREFIEYFENEVIRPRGFDYKIQFVGPTGTNAVEAALKLARKVKKRNNVCTDGCVPRHDAGFFSADNECGLPQGRRRATLQRDAHSGTVYVPGARHRGIYGTPDHRRPLRRGEAGGNHFGNDAGGRRHLCAAR